MYAQQGAEGAQAGPDAGGTEGASDEEVTDVDFEEVTDEEKK